MQSKHTNHMNAENYGTMVQMGMKEALGNLKVFVENQAAYELVVGWKEKLEMRRG